MNLHHLLRTKPGEGHVSLLVVSRSHLTGFRADQIVPVPELH